MSLFVRFSWIRSTLRLKYFIVGIVCNERFLYILLRWDLASPP
jgi:hypothetical protein